MRKRERESEREREREREREGEMRETFIGSFRILVVRSCP